MENIIKSIFYRISNLINYTNKVIAYVRIQNFNLALSFVSKTINEAVLVSEELSKESIYFENADFAVDLKGVNNILEELLEAQKNEDYIFLADLYEVKLIPYLLKIQAFIMSRENFILDYNDANIQIMKEKDSVLYKYIMDLEPAQEIEKEYCVEYTSCGLPTLAIIQNHKKLYFHTNGSVTQEAWNLAKEWISEEKENYHIYGLGLGYHVIELLDLNDVLTIYLYESDLNVIKMACKFSPVFEKILLDARVHLIYDPYFSILSGNLQQLDSRSELLIHYPSLSNINSKAIKERLEEYFLMYSSVKNQLTYLKFNFYKNINRYNAYVDELKSVFMGKDLFIVAAGPSLDKNYLQLKGRKRDSILMATGTVLKKLLKENIYPDYVIMTDATPGVYKQIEEIEEEVPLIYLSTLYHKVTENYQGMKYLVCQKDFQDSEDFAKEKKYQLYETGGSVSTLALDIGIRLECSKIIFLGLDLAYTGDKFHAESISELNETNLAHARQVKSIEGNIINTGKNLDVYRKWIENRIKGVENIKFINATEGGAYIAGMKNEKLSDCL